jgi:hypothetical protein
MPAHSWVDTFIGPRFSPHALGKPARDRGDRREGRIDPPIETLCSNSGKAAAFKW